ncbi:OsmC family protein [Rossellomorea aquimaris]|uniref:OsmC family protein n=1 Tax=Rossellomorea aquimaris TaxID=189382 RepID=UPI001CD81A99|nr:OsmC family protein [Rossellomorea aquimaris]MCA1056685.1 OsmC family protein [Rossellomorea aquimaris]
MAQHSFHIKTNWPGLRNDVGTLESGTLSSKISIPPEMDGPGIGTNPDEMLLGAAATCYIITLAAMLERSNIQKESLSMESEGIVEVEKGIITYKKIIHRPTLVLSKECTEKEMSKARRLAVKAEQSCMITRAIKGNVEVELEETIHIEN